MGVLNSSRSGHMVFLVRHLHQGLRVGRSGGAVRGGEQHHAAHAAHAQASRAAGVRRLRRQQAAQPLHLRLLPPQRPGLPHLVHRVQLLVAGPRRLLLGLHGRHERHDPHLLLPPAACRLLSTRKTWRWRRAQRHAQIRRRPPPPLTNDSEVPHRLTLLFFLY